MSHTVSISAVLDSTRYYTHKFRHPTFAATSPPPTCPPRLWGTANQLSRSCRIHCTRHIASVYLVARSVLIIFHPCPLYRSRSEMVVIGWLGFDRMPLCTLEMVLFASPSESRTSYTASTSLTIGIEFLLVVLIHYRTDALAKIRPSTYWG